MTKPCNFPGMINARRERALDRLQRKPATPKRAEEMTTLRERIKTPEAARAIRTKNGAKGRMQ